MCEVVDSDGDSIERSGGEVVRSDVTLVGERRVCSISGRSTDSVSMIMSLGEFWDSSTERLDL